MNFVAIDFETATGDRTSACAIGLAVVRDDAVVDEFHALIRPPTFDFSPKNIAIHGITPDRVAQERTFAQLWEDLARRIGDDLVLAHNAAFDIGVLHACLAHYNLPQPPLQYACTLTMARQTLPGLPNHRLRTLAAIFGIDLNGGHHDPLFDARACGRLGTIFGRLAGNDFTSFVHHLSDWRADHDFHEAHAMRYAVCCDETAPGKVRLVAPANSNGRFAGLRFVFTGELKMLSRDAAEAVVREQGGQASGSVSGATDYVVVGDEVLADYAQTGHSTGKHAKAVNLQRGGSKVKIVTEADFLKMVE